jgi:hypothetical protein
VPFIPDTEAWEFALLILIPVIIILILRAPYLIYKQQQELILKSEPPAHPHDVELLRKFRRKVPMELRNFLRLHDFHVPHRLEVTEPLSDIAEDWHGALYEFQDDELQSLFGEALEANSRLVILVGERIFAMDGNHKMGTAKNDLDRRHGWSEESLEGVKMMNDAALQLYGRIDDFERLALKKIKVAAIDARND